MSTTYLSTVALDQLDQAQAELDRHLAAGPDGRCTTCQRPEPCPARSAADATFAQYGRLPRRQPGLASHAVTAPTGFGAWFTPATTSSR